ncbi:MAG: hypothetical protein CVV05_01650 [Gammaproteobacteria bacterium HGW-Gammaproteobacteria-1]|jgi:hypothetical protein|nr:MAG: hypothetical protein CVV05_01650 [Gammaproteobacteria bacterium HGW-Gammaproteobacteria-1]
MRKLVLIYVIALLTPWLFIALGNVGYNLSQLVFGARVAWHFWPDVIWQVTEVWAGMLLVLMIAAVLNQRCSAGRTCA